MMPVLGVLILQAAYGAVDLLVVGRFGTTAGLSAVSTVMTQGLIQTLLVRLPLAYFMSIQPNASLTQIGLAAPIATCVGILLNVTFYFIFSKKQNKA